jgi:hypothetical protein
MDRQDDETQKRNKPIRVTPLPDGTIRYFDPGGFDKTGLIMKRTPLAGADSSAAKKP